MVRVCWWMIFVTLITNILIYIYTSDYIAEARKYFECNCAKKNNWQYLTEGPIRWMIQILSFNRVVFGRCWWSFLCQIIYHLPGNSCVKKITVAIPKLSTNN